MNFDFKKWNHPPVEYSQCPFWFWNDELREDELLRQIADFQAHGVEAFVIHPRIGLPRSMGWLGSEFLHFMRLATEEASKRGMWILLYDEGMYPSGSAGGLIVAQNPELQARGLVCVKAREESPIDPPEHLDRRLVASLTSRSGEPLMIYDQRVPSVIRGLHYHNESADGFEGEEEPAAADLLNPRSIQRFIELVHERFYRELGEYFGSTIKGIFTDEPSPLSRIRLRGVMPGTTGILDYVNDFGGYDFRKHLPALWFKDEPDFAKHQHTYHQAIAARLRETYYQPLAKWCEDHGIALTGHPEHPDDLGHLRYFHIPGQDIVWRQIEPGKPSTLEGPSSTMAKAAASCAAHHDRKRNLNEYAGAYGESLTYEEFKWLASWLLIRGCNLLVPHAYYYSMRGPRRLERPPDVGPNQPWWNDYRSWADFTRRLCWLNAEYAPVCHVAIMGRESSLPWKAAKACFEHQIDFHYIEPRDLENASAGDGALQLGKWRYDVVVQEPGYETPIPAGVPVIHWQEGGMDALRLRVDPVVSLDSPAPDIRARRLRSPEEPGHEIVMLFNEGSGAIRRRVVDLPRDGLLYRLHAGTGEATPCNPDGVIELPAHGWVLFLQAGH